MPRKVFQTYAIYKDVSKVLVLPNIPGLFWSVYSGVAGMAGGLGSSRLGFQRLMILCVCVRERENSIKVLEAP